MNNLKFIKQTAFYLLFGIYCGLCGTLFSKAVSFVTDIRIDNDWLIYLLPFAGLISVYLFKLFNTFGMGTNHVIKSCTKEESISPFLAIAMFLCSVISHLFGASVGREGAALQIGGGLASSVNRIFKLNEEQRKLFVYCGMAGVFSSVFGTPLAAVAFAIQIVYIWRINLKTLIPLFITSYTSYFSAKLLGAHSERFTINHIPDFSFLILIKVVSIAFLSGLVAMLFCYSLKYCEKLFEILKNPYLRIFTGGLITVLLTLAVNCNDYNGAGVNIINNIFTSSHFKPEAFILKLIFTCVAASSGFKGGEIVPSLFIGATFGSLIASILGFPISFGAAIGMTAIFCGVTKCPLSALFLSLEMFSGNGFVYMIISVAIAFIFSGKISFYSAQNKDFTKKS